MNMYNMWWWFHYFSESVKLSGEGKYNLNAIKEIKVTDSFLGLDMEDKGCQNEEPIENCTTRNYIETLLHQCSCLPLKLTEAQNVKLLIVSPNPNITSDVDIFRPQYVLLIKWNVLKMWNWIPLLALSLAMDWWLQDTLNLTFITIHKAILRKLWGLIKSTRNGSGFQVASKVI